MQVHRREDVPLCFSSPETYSTAAQRLSSSSEVKTESEEPSLDDAARAERDYVRSRLREELKREPEEEEIDEWLRQHTEGY